MYGNDDLRRTYAEICDVEEEHVTMYESLIDPTETMLEKWVLHEFTEVCTYYNCYKDEVDEKIKQVWEEFLAMEIEHLKIAAEFFEKHEKRDAEELIGTEILLPCHFESQKNYVANILETEIDKRQDGTEEMGYTTIDKLPPDWASYKVQQTVGENGAPTEQTIINICATLGRDIVSADKKLVQKQAALLAKGLEPEAQAPNTVTVKDYENMPDNSNFEELF